MALIPILIFVGTLMLQLGAAAWTTVAAETAARSAARAVTLDPNRDPLTVANESLPGTLSVRQIDPEDGGDDVRITVRVDVPRVSLLPLLTVTRDAVMPKISS